MAAPPSLIVIFLYNRLFDPLIMGNFWVFIEDIQTRLPGRYRFHLITFEDDTHPLTKAQSQRVSQMAAMGITWTALRWHRGSSVSNKIADIASGFLAVAKQRFRGFRHVISYGSVAGSFCYLYARALKVKLFMYTFEPHSEYSRDNAMLSESSTQYRVLHQLERRAAEYATVISSGTRFMRRRLEEEWRVKAKFFKIPSVADEKKFAFNSSIRAATRAKLGLEADRKVLFYPGKFGGLYYGPEVAQMFRWLLDEEADLFFLVLTPQPAKEIIAFFEAARVPAESYAIRYAEYDVVQDWFWAADFGIIAVPSGPSKQFISNIKVGEYLCAGLPFLITRGVSEDYLFATEREVGVVVDDFSEEAIRRAWPEIFNFLTMDPDQRRAHCTRAGHDYRGFKTLQPRFQAALEYLAGS